MHVLAQLPVQDVLTVESMHITCTRSEDYRVQGSVDTSYIEGLIGTVSHCIHRAISLWHAWPLLYGCCVDIGHHRYKHSTAVRFRQWTGLSSCHRGIPPIMIGSKQQRKALTVKVEYERFIFCQQQSSRISTIVTIMIIRCMYKAPTGISHACQ